MTPAYTFGAVAARCRGSRHNFSRRLSGGSCAVAFISQPQKGPEMNETAQDPPESGRGERKTVVARAGNPLKRQPQRASISSLKMDLTALMNDWKSLQLRSEAMYSGFEIISEM